MYDVEHSHIFRLEMAPVIKEMLIRFSDGMEDGLLKKTLQNTERLQPLLTHLAPAVSPVINALLRTTLAFTAAKGADCYNVLPQEAYVVGNMRFSHHQGHDKSIAAITKFAKKYDIETEIISDGFSSRITDFNGEPFHIVENTIAEIFPDVKCAPYLMTGASDSRYMDRVCENCIRFTPFVVTSEQVSMIHGVDENVDVSCLSPAVDFFKKIMLGV